MCVFGVKPTKWGLRKLPDSLSPDGLDLLLPLPEGDLGDDVTIGWKIWYFNRLGQKTVTGSYGARWVPGEVMVPRFGQPTRYNVAGTYAFKNEASVAHAMLYGEVLLWGNVAEYENGYRAQYAYPLSFFTIRTDIAKYLRAAWVKDGVYINVGNKQYA